jgi:hypothetical protein
MPVQRLRMGAIGVREKRTECGVLSIAATVSALWPEPAIEYAEVADRPSIAMSGRGACRRFKDTLYRWPELVSRWYALSDDRQRGRARAWLADHGYSRSPWRVSQFLVRYLPDQVDDWTERPTARAASTSRLSYAGKNSQSTLSAVARCRASRLRR